MQRLSKRLNNHRTQTTDYSPVSKWVKSLVLQGKAPLIEAIEEVEPELWREREKFWILHYRSIGAKLFNVHDGGEGLTVCTPEHRAKIRKANKNRKPSALCKRNQHEATRKLTDQQVLEICRLSAGGMFQRAIAKKFGIDQALVSRIVSGKRWLNLPRETTCF